MKCYRCKGTLITERIYTREGNSFITQRCTMCGDVIDQVILKHREMQGRMNHLMGRPNADGNWR